MLTPKLLVGLVLLGAQFEGETGARREGDYALITGAEVVLIDEVEIPAEQAGVLKFLQLEDGTRVREGVEVSEGALLGKLDDRDANARHEAARLDKQVAEAEEQKSLVAIDAAVATVEVAQAEYEESLEINRNAPRTIPKTQTRRQMLTEKRSRAEAEVARSDSMTAGLTVKLRESQLSVAQINVERHEIRSVLDGEVVQVYRHVGEWVNPGDPILHVVRLDRLRVQTFLQLSDFARAEVVGQPVTLRIRLRGNRDVEFKGKVTFVSPLVQTTGEYAVWCEVDNKRVDGQWGMLPGMVADMKIHLKKLQLAAAR